MCDVDISSKNVLANFSQVLFVSLSHISVGFSLMSFLEAKVIDENFDVLYRAWCVAEIVEANVLLIPARTATHSKSGSFPV